MSTNSSKILKKTLLVFLMGVVSYACQLAYTRILTSNLPLDLYGDFSVAWKSLFLMSQILTYGSAISAQRFISHYLQKKEHSRKRGFIYWLCNILLRSVAILCVAYCIFWAVASVTNITGLYSFDQYHLAMYTIILAPALSIISIATSLALSFGHATLSALTGTVIFRGIQLLVGFVCFSIFVPRDIMHLSYVLTAILGVLMAAGIAIALWIPENEIISTLSSKKKHPHDHEWLLVARSACLNQIMYTLAGTVDLYIIEIFSPEEDHVGLFGICGVCVAFLRILQSAMNTQLITPIMTSGDMRPKEVKSLQKSLDIYNVVKICMVLAGLVLIWIFSQEIFAFFNVKTTLAYQLLPLMVMNVYLSDNRYQFSLLMAKRQMNYVNFVEITSVIIMTVMASILVFPYDMYGVVYANTVARCYTKALLTYRCRQLSTMRMNLFA